MEGLKERLPLVGLGVAALAIAGYLLFAHNTESKKEEKKEEKIEAEPEPIPRFYFIDAKLSQEEKEKAIYTWVENSIKELLAKNEDGTLKAPKFQLSHEDFLELTNIVRNRCEAFIFDEKQNLQSKRIKIAAEKGFESLDYLNALIKDQRNITGFLELPIETVLELAKVTQQVLECSYENYVGDGQDISADSILKQIEILYFYPIAGNCNGADAPEYVKKVFT